MNFDFRTKRETFLRHFLTFSQSNKLTIKFLNVKNSQFYLLKVTTRYLIQIKAQHSSESTPCSLTRACKPQESLIIHKVLARTTLILREWICLHPARPRSSEVHLRKIHIRICFQLKIFSTFKPESPAHASPFSLPCMHSWELLIMIRDRKLEV